MSEKDDVLHGTISMPHWCAGQRRAAILIRHDVRVTEMPFRAHPDIPAAKPDFSRRHTMAAHDPED
jgi:hypothetical protein